MEEQEQRQWGFLQGISVAMMMGIALINLANHSEEKSCKKQYEFNRKFDTGITHQYIDTNRDGKYDLYRFIQKGSETMLIDSNGDGIYDAQQVEDKSRVFKRNLETEETKEECEREYRPGNIEFLTLE